MKIRSLVKDRLSSLFSSKKKRPSRKTTDVERPNQGVGTVARMKELFSIPNEDSPPPVPPPPPAEFISQVLIRNRQDARKRSLRERQSIQSEGSWNVSDSE